MPLARPDHLKATSLALLATLTVAWPRHAGAATQVSAPAGGGLPALAVRVDLANRTIDAGGSTIPIGLDPAQIPPESDISAEVIAIGNGRHVVHVRVPSRDSAGVAWEAILAGGHAPVFAGLTGLTSGDPGERTGKAIEVRPNGESSFVLVGDVREDLGICGQAVTLLSPEALYPASLELRPATVQRLRPEAQASAVEVTAVEKGAEPDPPLVPLLVARGSSVHDDRGAALTDGDVSTSWSEQRPGVGQGEFVVMGVPSEVPIARLQIAIRPADGVAGAAPRTFYIATHAATFRVVLPADGWSKPGKTFEVTLPRPVETSCLALVLDTAYARGEAHPQVTVSELVAYSEFDAPGATLADVAAKLSGPRATAAAQVLERGGRGSLQAVAKVYDTLEPRGRALAMDVASSQDKCEDAVPLLSRGLCEVEGQAPRKALEKLQRCRSAAPALAVALRDDEPHRACIAPVLAELAPADALGPIADAMGRTAEGDRVTRDALRGAFARALASSPTGVLAPLLGSTTTPPSERLEVLRAAGPRVTEAPAESEAAVGQLLQGAPPMRVRYLVLAPLAELARVGDRAASSHIADALAHDAEWPVRARAAELAARLPDAQHALAGAARDAEPRVREAALASVAQSPSPDGVRAAADALAADPWPFVRAQAISVLSAAGPTPQIDDVLGQALADPSPRVRGGAILAIGKHHAMAWRGKVRDVFAEPSEDVDVRAEAAWTLGAMCDAESLDRLTSLARGLAEPAATDDDRQLGLASLIALAALKPADLGDRLGPLLAKGTPEDVRHAAEKAMAARGTCR
jgi:HEAT repeat protein